MLGSIEPCHIIPMLVEFNLLDLMNTIWMSGEIRQSVDGRLSAFYLHRFTTTASNVPGVF